MAETDYLKLYKKDPVADRNDTFNITTMLNDNWDKLDTALFNLNKDKVDKITGKGLSTNDFTTTLKNKLDGIESGAQVNTVTSVAGKTGAVTVNKSDVGLSNVDNVKQATKVEHEALDTKVTSHLADDVQHGKIGTKEVDESEIGDKATLSYSAELGKWVVKRPPLDDLTNSPGSPYLISGTMQEGFFGEVPASELYTASQIASACGISQGTAQFETEPWLKFAIDGKIIYRPRKAIRHSISWNSINAANCVYGGSEGKRVTKNGQTYIVRLMKGALTDPSKFDATDMGAKGSEWNRLMLPIHEQAIDKSWAYPNYVEENVPVWSHNLGTGANGMYTDSDLMTDYNYGNGSYNWCQETTNTDAARRVHRGSRGVSDSGRFAALDSSPTRGWSPVLELVEEEEN